MAGVTPDELVVTPNRSLLLEQFPQFKTIPTEHTEIILWTMVGFSASEVAEQVKCSKQTVYNILERYEIAKILRQQADLQKLFVANELGSIMVQAIASIRDKKNELKNMTLQQLVKFISDCSGIVSDFKLKRVEHKPSEAELLEQIRDK